jgi:hypothetical protein
MQPEKERWNGGRKVSRKTKDYYVYFCLKLPKPETILKTVVLLFSSPPAWN